MRDSRDVAVWLEPRELLVEIALLQVGQYVVVRRVAEDKFTVRFQREMTPKEKRQQEYDWYWVHAAAQKES